MRLSALTTALLFSLGLPVAGCRSQSTPAASINVYEPFEAPSLGNLWETDRFAPGAVEMQSAIVRAGHGAAKITVHSKDVFETGIHGNADSERAELLEARNLTSKQSESYQFSWSMFLPADFPIVPVRLVVAQWKQYCGVEGAPCGDDSPVLAIRYIDGVLLITQDLAHKPIVLYQEKSDLRTRWLDLRFQVRFSPEPTGRIKAWLGDKQVIDYTGVTANAEDAITGYASPSRFYFKMGLYRNVMPQPMTIYLDEYRKRQITTISP